MNPDLQHLIQLQRLETERDNARRGIDAMPSRREAIEARVTEAQARVAAVREQGAGNQAARRSIEKDLSVVQGRLTKFKDQLMEVKTNKEYLAMQHEIATADGEVKRLEDLLLERMMDADEISGALKQAEADLASARAQAQRDSEALAAEHAALERALGDTQRQRDELASGMPAEVVVMFDQIRAKRGTAVVEARDGHCTVCHVRLRPQIFNEIRHGEAIFKCDSCQRILYFAGPVATPDAAAAPPETPQPPA